MALSGTWSGVEALRDRDTEQYESYTTWAGTTDLPPTAVRLMSHVYRCTRLPIGGLHEGRSTVIRVVTRNGTSAERNNKRDIGRQDTVSLTHGIPRLARPKAA